MPEPMIAIRSVTVGARRWRDEPASSASPPASASWLDTREGRPGGGELGSGEVDAVTDREAPLERWPSLCWLAKLERGAPELSERTPQLGGVRPPGGLAAGDGLGGERRGIQPRAFDERELGTRALRGRQRRRVRLDLELEHGVVGCVRVGTATRGDENLGVVG